MKRKMQLTNTELPDRRRYETYDSEAERNARYNELKRRGYKVEQGFYDSVSGRIYFVIYKD